MLTMLLHWLISALALMLVAYILPGISISGLGIAMIATIIMGLVNMLVKPIMLLLTLPITLVTLGLFAFVINAAMFGLAAWLVPGFTVTGFWSALFGSILLTFISGVFNKLAKD